MATTVLGLKTFTASDPVDYNDINDNYNKIDNGVKTAFQGRAAHNLMDNSDFQINQRGSKSYTANGYAVDRWAIYKWSNDSSVSINLSVKTNGVSLTGGVSTASTPSSCYIYQKIDCARLAGKALTAAVYIDSLSGAGTGIIGAYNDSTYIKGATLKTGLNFITFDVPESATIIMIRIGNDASHAGKGSITASIKWAALYEGSYTADTLPAYKTKGYAAELAECMRYYENSWFETNKSSTNEYLATPWDSIQADARIEFKQHKRILPTITLYPEGSDTQWKVFSQGLYYIAASADAVKRNGLSGFIVRITKGDSDTSTWTIGSTIQARGHWEASADL